MVEVGRSFVNMYKFFIEEQGAAAIEYGLLVSLIGMAVAGALQILGNNIFGSFTVIDSALSLIQNNPSKQQF
jgi:Flp pilus assembly pilin Flp